MMKNASRFCLYVLNMFVLLSLGSAAHATYYFSGNATVSTNVPDNVIIGYGGRNEYFSHTYGTSPTVNFVSGASITGFVVVCNQSTFNMSGGSISGTNSSLYSGDSTTVNLSGGSVSVLDAYGNGIVTISGGSIDYLVAKTNPGGIVNINGGIIGTLNIDGPSTVNLRGGILGSYIRLDEGVLNLFGTGLTATLVDPKSSNGQYSEFSLSGTLSDGTVLTHQGLLVTNLYPAELTINGQPVIGVPVSGTVALDGVPDLSTVNSHVPLGTFHISLRTPGTRKEVQGFDLALYIPTGSATGKFWLNGVRPGIYDVWIKGSKNLAALIPNIAATTASGLTLPDVTLLGGDANNDNVVDIGDFGVLVNAYNGDMSIPNSGYAPAADFNYDGVVDVGDFGILVNNYGSSGDL